MPLLCLIAVSVGNVNQLGVVVVHLIYILGHQRQRRRVQVVKGAAWNIRPD